MVSYVISPLIFSEKPLILSNAFLLTSPDKCSNDELSNKDLKYVDLVLVYEE
jgi:hypothetical protein